MDRNSTIYVPHAAQIRAADDLALPSDADIPSRAETAIAATVSIIRDAASRTAVSPLAGQSPDQQVSPGP